jgi:hypothetical protein
MPSMACKRDAICGFKRLHAGRAQLHRQQRAVTIDHQSWQAVAFAVNQPTEFEHPQARAQRQRGIYAPAQPGLSVEAIGGRAEQTSGNQHIGVDVGDTP